MRILRATDLRRSLSRVTRLLGSDHEPVPITLRGRIVGVLISVRDWNERFTSREAQEERRRLAAEILADRRPTQSSIEEALERFRLG